MCVCVLCVLHTQHIANDLNCRTTINATVNKPLSRKLIKLSYIRDVQAYILMMWTNASRCSVAGMSVKMVKA